MADKRPPYTSQRDLDQLFDRMRTIGDPGSIDRKWIESFSLAESQPEAVLSALRWLNVIDKDGESQGVWNDLRLPNTRAATLKRLMEEAYQGVFSLVNVSEADRQDLEGAFISAYSSGDPSKPIKCFLTLCRHAGIEVKAGERQAHSKPTSNGSNTTRPRKQPERSARRGSKATGGSNARVPSDQGAPVALTLNVEIPGEWSEEQVRDRVAAVRRAIQAE